MHIGIEGKNTQYVGKINISNQKELFILYNNNSLNTINLDSRYAHNQGTHDSVWAKASFLNTTAYKITPRAIL